VEDKEPETLVKKQDPSTTAFRFVNMPPTLERAFSVFKMLRLFEHGHQS
jgi:hypothetical protein